MIKFQSVFSHDVEAADQALAGRIAEALLKHYPGHPWAVHVDSDGGMVTIFNLAVSLKFGYRLKLARVYLDPDLKCIMRAGGEILERANMPRGWWDGVAAARIEGTPEKYQPINGLPI